MWEIAGINGEQVKLKIHAIPWFSLIFLAFLLSGGGEPMAHLPRKGSPPPRPPSPLSATRKFVALGELGR